jgi:protein LTV1
MGGRGEGGGGRKPRNFATFRLFPRAGAANPNERVFVRVDNNDYSVPGFGDEGPFDSDLTADAADHHSSRSGPLPEHLRREILELGLPDDGYNYLAHLRELRPSAGAASSFVPSSTARPEPLPLDVKVAPSPPQSGPFYCCNCNWNAYNLLYLVQAYDASRVRVAPSADDLDEGRTMCKVAAKTAPLRRVQRAVDPDVARLLDESDVSHVGSEDEGLEEDFIIMANKVEGEDEVEEELGNGVFSDVEEDEELEDEPKPRVRRLLDEQFDLVSFFT